MLLTLIASSGVKSPVQAPPGVEVSARRSDKGTLTYLLNHTATAQLVRVAGSFKDLLTGSTFSGTVGIDPYGVRVLQPA